MNKTAVSAPAPRPTDEEMLKAIENMTWQQLLDFKDKFEKLVQEKREQKVEERGGDNW